MFIKPYDCILNNERFFQPFFSKQMINTEFTALDNINQSIIAITDFHDHQYRVNKETIDKNRKK